MLASSSRSLITSTLPCARRLLPKAFSRRHVAVKAMAAQASKVQPTEAAQLLEAGYTYLDVRTPQEFAAGHVKESVNIPLMLSTPQGMQPNPDFLQQVKQQFPQGDEQLIVGCKAGNRSARACAMLAEENYSTLADQTGGFDGWVTANLPVVQ